MGTHHHHHHHRHHHDHHHGPGGHHHHAPAAFGSAFAVGMLLNGGFVVVEAVYGVLAGSMALVADAGHNLSDVLGLGMAWTAAVLARRPSSARYSYGMRGSTILAALANAALLLMTLGAIVVESVRHLITPEPVAGTTVMIVAAIGILINGATALLFMGGRDHDLNLRGAWLHMLGDTAVSAGVVVSGLIIAATGWNRLDPLVSLIITLAIGWGTWGLAREALRLGLAGVPTPIDATQVAALIARQDGVTAVHDLHIWAMSTTETALTAHLTMPGGHPGDAFLTALAHELDHEFGIGHITVQVETGHATGCDPHCGGGFSAAA